MNVTFLQLSGDANSIDYIRYKGPQHLVKSDQITSSMIKTMEMAEHSKR